MKSVKSLKQPNGRRGFILAQDETPIFYEVLGSKRSSSNLVFCDGIGCDGYVWKYFQQAFKDDYRIIHPHHRGHGKTPAPKNKSQVTVQNLADDVVSVLDACETQSAVLFGHSMGVQVALEAFRRHKERVSGLVLVCGSHSYPLRTFKNRDILEKILPWIRFVVNRIPRLSNFIWSHLLPSMLAYKVATKVEINGRLIQPEDFYPYLEGISRVDLRLFLRMLTAAGKHYTHDILDQITVPTLIIAGRHDSFTPIPLSEEMHGKIPGSELYIVEEGSHTAPIERPSEITSVVAEFLYRRIQQPVNTKK